MNLKGRYKMLRAATLNMVGVTDDLDTLKAMAGLLQIPALTDDDAKASLTMLQALIVTHDGAAGDIPEEWVTRTVEWIGDDRVAPDGVAARELITYILTGAKS